MYHNASGNVVWDYLTVVFNGHTIYSTLPRKQKHNLKLHQRKMFRGSGKYSFQRELIENRG